MRSPLEAQLIGAAADGDAAGVERLLTLVADSRGQGPHGMTALMQAAKRGAMDCVELLKDLPGRDAEARLSWSLLKAPDGVRCDAFRVAMIAGHSKCAVSILEREMLSDPKGEALSRAICVAAELSDWDVFAKVGSEFVKAGGPLRASLVQTGPIFETAYRVASERQWRAIGLGACFFDDPILTDSPMQGYFGAWSDKLAHAVAAAEALCESQAICSDLDGSTYGKARRLAL